MYHHIKTESWSNVLLELNLRSIYNQHWMWVQCAQGRSYLLCKGHFLRHQNGLSHSAYSSFKSIEWTTSPQRTDKVGPMCLLLKRFHCTM